MPEETFLQHWIFTRFALPFLLVFFIAFAILEKTKLFGDDKKQLNALVAFVLGLIFVGVAYPTIVVSNLILFLTVALVVVFVVMILWGFIKGEDVKLPDSKGFKVVLFIILLVVVLSALLWATGWSQGFIDFFSEAGFESAFITNLFFIVVIAVALAVVLRSAGGGKS